MYLNHLAIWTDNIEVMRQFYMTYFGCSCNEKYVNEKKSYTSYFISFGNHKSKIELMHRPDIAHPSRRNFMKGMAHLDITVGDEKKVDEMVALLRKDGYTIASEPRRTGDGFYEAGILDPEGNLVDISAVRTDF